MLALFVSIVVAATHVPVVDPGRLAPAEVVLLLDLGLNENEIVATAERFGGLAPIDDDARRAIVAAGGSLRLLGMFEAAAPELDRLTTLARTYEAWRSDPIGVQLLHPIGWHVHPTKPAGGGTVVQVGPDGSNGTDWFARPQMFVFLADHTGLVPETEEVVLEQLAGIMIRRLRDVHLAPELGGELEFSLSAQPIRLRLIEGLGADRRRAGSIAVGLRLDAAGHAIGIGFIAPEGQLDATAEAFRTFAGTLTFTRGG